MSMDVLKNDLKSKNIKNLYLFYGAEEYLKKYYLDMVEKVVVQKDFKDLNKIFLEGKQELSTIIECCETVPVFADKKLVVIKNTDLFKAKKAGGKKKEKASNKEDALESFLKEVPSHVCLVFYEEEIDKRLKLVEIIKKQGLIVEFAYQKPVELVKWVQKIATSKGKEMSNTTANKLVENCEAGMTDILNEMNKLVLYTSESKIIKDEDIDSVCIKSIKSRIFDLTDAIAEKNAAKAYRLLHEMIVIKEPLPRILYMIIRQFRQILEMKLLKQQGMSTGDATTKMGMTSYAATKVIKQAERFKIDQLRLALEECLTLDVAIKTGQIKDRNAIELFIATFSVPTH